MSVLKKLVKLGLCEVLGHRRWDFAPAGALMQFRDHRRTAYVYVELCERCWGFYVSAKVPVDPDTWTPVWPGQAPSPAEPTPPVGPVVKGVTREDVIRAERHAESS